MVPRVGLKILRLAAAKSLPYLSAAALAPTVQPVWFQSISVPLFFYRHRLHVEVAF
jgi:hypothetical protein